MTKFKTHVLPTNSIGPCNHSVSASGRVSPHSRLLDNIDCLVCLKHMRSHATKKKEAISKRIGEVYYDLYWKVETKLKQDMKTKLLVCALQTFIKYKRYKP